MRLLLTLARDSEVPVALGVRPDLLDVKDPDAGSLGAPDPELLRAVAARVDGRIPLSVPLGDGPREPAGLRRTIDRLLTSVGGEERIAFLKVGMLGTGVAEGASLLAAASDLLDARGSPARLVAVTFADAEPGTAPSPGELPEIALRGGAGTVMLDTLGKRAGSVLDRLGRERLRRWSGAARRRGLRTAVAGGIDAALVPRLGGLGLDVVGVRGGACLGGRRTGRLDPERCRELRRAVRRASGEEASGVGDDGSDGDDDDGDHVSSVDSEVSARRRRVRRSG